MRTGFKAAKGDTLIILDADLAAALKELPKFFDAVAGGVGDFTNRVRFIYPQQEKDFFREDYWKFEK